MTTALTPPVTEDVPVIKIGNATFRLIFHDLYRPLTEGEYAGLKDSIERHGIRQDITVVSHGNLVFDVIDGAHRLKAAAELGYKLERIPKKETIGTPDELRDLAETLNEDRRQLTVEERRERALKLRQQGQSYRQIGEALGVSQETARADIKGTVNDLTVDLPPTIKGKDGKERPAADPTPTAAQIALARDLIPEALRKKHAPLSFGQLLRDVQKLEGGSDVARWILRPAVEAMLEAGTLVERMGTSGREYHLPNDPAIKPIQAVQQRNAEAKKREIASAVIEVLMVATGPMTYREVETAVNAKLGHIVNPGIFSGVVSEMRRESRIRAVAGGRYALPVPDAEQPGESLAPEEETDATAWLNTPVVKEKQPEPTAALVPATEPPANGNSSIHFSSESAEWYTPPSIIERVVEALGDIDLDPCSNSHTAPHVPAKQHYAKEDDGLSKEWSGAVYLNPPYGREIAQWVEKLVAEHTAGRVPSAIALVPARTDTAWFAALRDYPRCFIQGRIKFLTSEGVETDPAPFPSMAVYLGPDRAAFIKAFSPLGDIYARVEAE